MNRQDEVSNEYWQYLVKCAIYEQQRIQAEAANQETFNNYVQKESE